MNDSHPNRPVPGAGALLMGLTGVAAMLLALALVAVAPRNAAANPAMAAKTGQPCGKCHSTAPALNSYGKAYKKKAR